MVGSVECVEYLEDGDVRNLRIDGACPGDRLEVAAFRSAHRVALFPLPWLEEVKAVSLEMILAVELHRVEKDFPPLLARMLGAVGLLDRWERPPVVGIAE